MLGADDIFGQQPGNSYDPQQQQQQQQQQQESAPQMTDLQLSVYWEVCCFVSLPSGVCASKLLVQCVNYADTLVHTSPFALSSHFAASCQEPN
jgi:hypothetical protein